MTQLNTAQQDIVTRFGQLNDPAQQLQTLQAMRDGLFPEGDAGKTRVWMTLFVVLGITLIIFAVGAMILLINDRQTGAALLIAPASAIITGLLGLFAKSPVS